MDLVQLSITFLAVLTGFIPAYFIDGLFVQKIGEGRVRTIFHNGVVHKPIGVLIILVEIAIGAGVAVISDGFFQSLYERSASRLVIIAFGVVLGLIVVARMRIGGCFGGKETGILAVLGALGFLFFVFGVFGSNP